MWTGNYGGHGRFSYGVIGSEVNLSARLMSKAQPGRILISERMQRQRGAADRFEMTHLGDWPYKGFDAPIRRSFLENVPCHREVMAVWQAAQHDNEEKE